MVKPPASQKWKIQAYLSCNNGAIPWLPLLVNTLQGDSYLICTWLHSRSGPMSTISNISNATAANCIALCKKWETPHKDISKQLPSSSEPAGKTYESMKQFKDSDEEQKSLISFYQRTSRISGQSKARGRSQSHKTLSETLDLHRWLPNKSDYADSIVPDTDFHSRLCGLPVDDDGMPLGVTSRLYKVNLRMYKLLGISLNAVIGILWAGRWMYHRPQIAVRKCFAR